MKNLARLFVSAAVLAVMLCLVVSCTIKDDHGNPIDPGDPPVSNPGDGPGNNPGSDNPGGPGVQPMPHFEFLPDSAYIRPGDTLNIRFLLWADTGHTALPLARAAVEVSSSDGKDYLSVTKLTTNAQGYGTVRFSSDDDNDGLTRQAELTFRYGALSAKLQIRVSSEPPRYTSISASPSLLAADGSSKSLITMQVKNDRNNPIVGDTVRFATSHGLIPAVGVTDADGKATVELTSAQSNVTANVTAYLKTDATLSESIRVEFFGVTMSATATPTSIKPTGGESIVRVTLLDAVGNPIVGERGITFAANPSAGVTIATLANETDSRGEMAVRVTSSGAGSQTTITARAPNAGASASTVITFSSNNLTITGASGNSMRISTPGNIRQSTFTVNYATGGGSPIADANLDVSVTAGNNIGDGGEAIFTTKLQTNGSGNATFTFDNPSFAASNGIIAVRATKSGSSEVTTLEHRISFRSSGIDSLYLIGTPAVVSINAHGSNSNRVKLTVTAYDNQGNCVAGENIAFNLVRSGCCGEYFEPATAVTDADGTASVFLVAGPTPSDFKGVHVRAASFSDPAITSNIVQLTIAGPPHSIMIGRNFSEITKKTATYEASIVALVSDVNGNPVDNTEVTFSATVTGYRYYRRVAHFINNEKSVANGREWDTTDTYSYVDVVSEHLNAPAPYNPYPEFNDINKNGIPDRGYFVEPCDPLFVYTGDPDIDYNCGGYPFADYNGNHVRDTVEYFIKGDPLGANDDPEHEVWYRHAFTGPHVSPVYDIDATRNGIADPQSTVLIKRTAQTVDGVANTVLEYGMSDAGKIEVTIYAEANGLVTEAPRAVPQKFVLPLAEGDERYWNPFE